MNRSRQYLLAFIAIFISAISQAQDVIEEKPEMATGLRSNGKIYVVVTIVLTILLVLIAYLFYVDRKISRLEKEINK